jgi:hypothetical protein
MTRAIALTIVVAGIIVGLLVPWKSGRAQEPMTTQELRAVVDTLFAGDTAAIEDLLRFASVPCVAESEGLGSPPVCRKGEAEGTLVEVFPSAVCEGFYLRSDEVQPIIGELANAGPEVLAAYRYGPPSPEAFFYGEFVAVATIGGGPPPQNGGGVFIGEGGITGLAYGCAQTAVEFAQFWGLTEQVDLGQATATPTATATAQLTATPVATALPSTGTGNPRDGAGGGLSICVALIALGSLAVVAVGITLFRQAKG